MARAKFVLTVEAAVLLALAEGPVKMALLCTAAQLNRKRLYRIIDAMHHAGQVKRLGVKGWSVWCLTSYHGPRPRIVHPAHIVRTRPRPRDRAPLESWWALNPVTRDEFEQALRKCARARGWIL